MPETGTGAGPSTIEEATALADELEASLSEIEDALGRLEEGRYGTCQLCDAPLADADLAAEPARRRCQAHAGS